MPLVVICGYPSSGKTEVCSKLKEFMEKEKGKSVVVISENDIVGERKNEIFADSNKEKSIRSALRGKVEQHISRGNIVILDGLNYIKSLRYELHCVVKSEKTLHCVIQCGFPKEKCLKWNNSRTPSERYNENIFNELVMRFEEPDSRNRWDSPLFVLSTDSELQYKEIYNALFERTIPPPNQSTIQQPMSSGNFLHNLDQTTQSVIVELLDIQKVCCVGDSVKLKGVDDRITLLKKYNMADLRRIKRQFIAYAKMHPVEDVTKLRKMFIQFINSSSAY